MDTGRIIEMVGAWAESDDKVMALALVGSYARGSQRPDSDIDLVAITEEPNIYLKNPIFMGLFGTLTGLGIEDYGAVTSIRGSFREGHEIELSFALPSWISLPLDAGTAEVLRGGFKVIFDRSSLFVGLRGLSTADSISSGGGSLSVLERLCQAEEPWSAFAAIEESGKEGLSKNEKRREMISHPLVKELVSGLSDWSKAVISSHKSASQPYHRLSFLADIGIRAEDANVQAILDRAWEHVSEEGLIELPMNIPTAYGGSGETTWAWAACDAPILLYAMAKIGDRLDERILKGRDFLMGLMRSNGWGCNVSAKLGNFRGPGRKSDPCPYVNLIMLKLISLYEDLLEGPYARTGIECLLGLWERSLVEHPYIFYMGNDFRKLKAPFIWYDILHLTEVLSRFPFAVKDERFKQMLGVVNSKADEAGMFKADSAYQAWKGWDFGQTKLPSSWITLCVERINGRVRDR